MTIAGFKILACPFCLELYKKRIYSSVNNFSSICYSDGEISKGFALDTLGIVKCINADCLKFFKIEETETIEEYDFKMGVINKYDNAHSLDSYKLGAIELNELLEINHYKDVKEELIIRTNLLRRYNDVHRQDSDKTFSTAEIESFSSNCERLIQLLKEDVTIEGKLFLAEIYREKADFDNCFKVLNEIKNEEVYDNLFKEKIFSQAKLKDHKVFAVESTAIKKEYQCNNCGESLILFNNDKNKSVFEYRHYICKTDNKVFDAPSKERNPIDFYRLSFWQKLFKYKVPYEAYTQRKQITCKFCSGSNVDEFCPETQKCINCGDGTYAAVKWF